MGTELEVRPVTPERWDDLVALFGERGATGGCWCMFFRLTSAGFQEVERRSPTRPIMRRELGRRAQAERRPRRVRR